MATDLESCCLSLPGIMVIANYLAFTKLTETTPKIDLRMNPKG